jgi:hypothetical protein
VPYKVGHKIVPDQFSNPGHVDDRSQKKNMIEIHGMEATSGNLSTNVIIYYFINCLLGVYGKSLNCYALLIFNLV